MAVESMTRSLRSSAGQRRALGLVRLAWLAIAWLLLAAGPADAATYTFRTDSYAWETASTAITWDNTCTDYKNDDDKATISFTGGFKFTFAGTAYSSVRVLTNGGLQFGSDTGFFRDFTNTNLPAAATAARSGCAAGAAANVMMAYWADLDPGRLGSGRVYWQQKGIAPNRYVVVSWEAVYQYDTSTPYTFQIILYENGEFKYQYGNANASGSNATIGVQVSGSDYTLYAYNSGYNANGSAIRWSIPTGDPVRVAEYRFDEYSWAGTTGEVRDSSGNRHDGTAVGKAVNHADGYICRALDAAADTSAATTAAVDTALDVDAALGNEGSVSMWYRSNLAWKSMPDAQLFDATTTSGRSFHLVLRSGGSLRFAASDEKGSTLVADASDATIGAGTWVHLTATWRFKSGSNQSVLRLYRNGVLLGTKTGTTTGSLDPSLGTLFLGDNRSGITSNNATVNSANGRLDEVRIYNYEISAAEIALDMAQKHECAPPLHHLEIRHATGTGLTCTPSTLTLAACQDAACSSLYTGGVTGTLAAVGAGMSVNWPDGAAFSIPAGSGTVDWRLHQTTAGSTLLSIGSPSPAATSAATCNFGSPSCTFTASDAGFVFNVPDHVADAVQTVSVSAVKKADGSLACTPAFASVGKAVTFTCSTADPATGTLPVRVAGRALNAGNSAASACDASGQAVTLAFDASGTASTTVQYADVGRMALAARYTGSGTDAGLSMSGSDGFVAAPASFAFSAITAAPIRAGLPFSATVTALNQSGAATPNFGRETAAEGVTLSFTRRSPTGAGASDGVFSGSLGAFSAGSATAATLRWTEVGTGDLGATLASGSYLGSGITASGSTGAAGAVGRFVPHHFDVAVTPACSASFSFAGQPFAVTVTARHGATPAGTTLNYDGSAATTPSQAKAVTLSEATALGLGSLSGASVPASAFVAGVAAAQPSYAFTAKQTAPQTLALRATDADGVVSTGFAEGQTPLRSGRLRLSNAFGGATQPLKVPVLSEYWTGQAWLLNSADSCSSLAAASVAVSNPRNHQGSSVAVTTSPSAVAIAAGQGLLTLGAPSPATSGVTFDLALNLGGTAADQSCLALHPATTGAAKPWLRSAAGACASAADRDPAARATFGIYSPETRKTVHAREIF